MKMYKFLLCVLLITILSAIYPPTKSIAKSNDSINKPDTAKRSSKTIDEKMLVRPKYNCDPKMLIPGNTNIDPGFLIKNSIKKK